MSWWLCIPIYLAGLGAWFGYALYRQKLMDELDRHNEGGWVALAIVGGALWPLAIIGRVCYVFFLERYRERARQLAEKKKAEREMEQILKKEGIDV